MNNREIIRELSRMLKVNPEDLPRTIRRFRKEVDEMTG